MRVWRLPPCFRWLCPALLSLAAFAEGPYVLLPVKTGNPQKVFRLMRGDEVLRFGSVEWADDDPGFQVGIDVGEWDPAELRMTLDGRAVPLKLSDSLPGEAEIYHEPARPRVHFSPRRGWLNDPNGLVHHQGVWHLFYQHNPYGVSWGNMHWGHAVSTDLAHWEERPIALRPLYQPSREDMAFSGSAVFDAQNTLGLPEGPALVAVYTSTGRGECLAFSHDNGRVWRDYPGNPVLVHGGSNRGTPGEDGFYHDSRDPKVFRWGGEDGHWVMVVYEQNAPDKRKPAEVTFAIYVSENLRDWERTQVLEGWYECAELFELEVEGRPGQRKWVLIEATGFYQIGNFDGRVFTADPREGTADPALHAFRDYIVAPGKYQGTYWNPYAGQGWNNLPPEDGRALMIFWIRGNVPKEKGRAFSQCMTIPVELSLRETSAGLRPHFQPAAELRLLEEPPVLDAFSGEGQSLDAALARVDDTAFRMRGHWVIDPEKPSQLGIHGMTLTYDPATGEIENSLQPKNRRDPRLVPMGTRRSLPVGHPREGRISFDIVADQGAIEVFFADGRYYGAVAHEHLPPQRGLRQKNLRVEGLTIHPLRGIWRKP